MRRGGGIYFSVFFYIYEFSEFWLNREKKSEGGCYAKLRFFFGISYIYIIFRLTYISTLIQSIVVIIIILRPRICPIDLICYTRSFVLDLGATSKTKFTALMSQVLGSSNQPSSGLCDPEIS